MGATLETVYHGLYSVLILNTKRFVMTDFTKGEDIGCAYLQPLTLFFSISNI